MRQLESARAFVRLRSAESRALLDLERLDSYFVWTLVSHEIEYQSIKVPFLSEREKQ